MVRPSRLTLAVLALLPCDPSAGGQGAAWAREKTTPHAPHAHPPGRVASRVEWVNRLTWGIHSLGDLQRNGPGSPAWLDQQLNDTLPDPPLPQAAADQIAALRITTTPLPQLVTELEAQHRDANALTDPDQKKAANQEWQKSMNALADEARTRFLLRALYSPAQLREQMTWFWFNHFNVQAGKRDNRALVGDYENTLRTLALGSFPDLLRATLRHPAMLRYLDNDQNAAGHINENYAREIMELHTMGVEGGYTQQDVQELARILTGLDVRVNPTPPKLPPRLQPLYVRDGLFEFNPARHDFGEKQFLGQKIEGTGYAEIEQALYLIATSPATAHHVCARIAAFFMGDPAPARVVDHMAHSFITHQGSIAQVLRTMITDPDFVASVGTGFKDPVHDVISAVRLAYGDRVILNARPMITWINQMGEGLYNHETPDGYSLAANAWSGPGQMTTRFEIARQIGGQPAGLFRPPGASADQPGFPLLHTRLYYDALQTTLGPATQDTLEQALSPQEWNALYLSSPEFMAR